MDKKELEKQAIEWYTENRDHFKSFSENIANILEKLLQLNSINFHKIEYRTKDLKSFTEKIKHEKYTDPQTQLTDLSGIRIICYVESDINKIKTIVENNFLIDLENSGDKSKLLGIDKVGYKSFHYIGELLENRLCLPEYEKFRNFKVEIQIRTILQHAWAEIEHDRSYKFSGELPEDISRRFKLLSGNLELIDIEFDNIAKEIDTLSEKVEEGILEGNLNFDLNTTTLKQFLLTKFEKLIPNIIQPIFGPENKSGGEIINELEQYDITNLEELNKIIPADFLTIYPQFVNSTNFIGVLRHLMLINDYQKYLGNCQFVWDLFSIEKYKELFKYYQISFQDIINFKK